jgi:hypothetical protein
MLLWMMNDFESKVDLLVPVPSFRPPKRTRLQSGGLLAER